VTVESFCVSICLLPVRFFIVLSSEPGQPPRPTGATTTATSYAAAEARNDLLGIAMIIEYSHLIKSFDLVFLPPRHCPGLGEVRQSASASGQWPHTDGKTADGKGCIDSSHGLGQDFAIAFVTADAGPGGWRKAKRGER
jgi:hypothetical protein